MGKDSEMNAYELAKQLEERHAPYEDDAANMLRQQADRIAELEKQGKPVAWMSPDGKVSQTEGSLFYIPLFTTPQTKPLSDEEIWKEWSKFYPDVFHTHLIDFVRAIEERHGIK